MSKGGSSGESTTTTVAEIPEYQRRYFEGSPATTRESRVQRMDASGQPILDENGQPTYDTTYQQIPASPGLWPEAQRLYNEYRPQYFPGQMVAGVHPLQEQGSNMLVGAGYGGISQLAGSNLDLQQRLSSNAPMDFAYGMLNRGNENAGYLRNWSNATGQWNADQASGLYQAAMNPYRNPALVPYIQQATQPVWDRLTNQALPAVRGGAVGAGQYGSSRQGIAEGLAIQSALREAGDISSTIGSQAYERGLDVGTRAVETGMGNVTSSNTAGMANVSDLLNQAGSQAVTQYGQGLDAQTRALSVAPQSAELLTMPGQVIGGAGDFWRQTGQEMLNAEMDRWNWGQQLPYNLLNMYQGQISGSMPMNSTTSMNTGGNSALNTMLQLGGGAASLYGLSQMGGGQNMSPLMTAMMMGNMWR